MNNLLMRFIDLWEYGKELQGEVVGAEGTNRQISPVRKEKEKAPGVAEWWLFTSFKEYCFSVTSLRFGRFPSRGAIGMGFFHRREQRTSNKSVTEEERV
ncbi:hypothetical protein CEXT_88881 [Caerostris extrusa]|uniref:Uncharacterized protein n=1 Tax=Caerostris extrusa TaxID=172846 RepID=A0AAV4YD50_CAEEX|nr:hypothetical protein CEXT_88881 [Caerostris extrusa]